MSALLFLGMVDANGTPTNRLKVLVTSRDIKRTDILKQCCTDAFDFLFQSSFDPQTATYDQLREMFHNTFQMTSGVSRKCIKFFVDMAKDAGIPLSPFITKQLRTAHSGTAAKTFTKKLGPKTARNFLVPQSLDEIPERMSWDKMLLNKFPSFDPSWPDEVKLKWFQAFDELLRRGLTKP